MNNTDQQTQLRAFKEQYLNEEDAQIISDMISDIARRIIAEDREVCPLCATASAMAVVSFGVSDMMHKFMAVHQMDSDSLPAFTDPDRIIQ